MAGPIKKSLVDAKSRGFFSHLALPTGIIHKFSFRKYNFLAGSQAVRIGDGVQFAYFIHFIEISVKMPADIGKIVAGFYGIAGGTGAEAATASEVMSDAGCAASLLSSGACSLFGDGVCSAWACCPA